MKNRIWQKWSIAFRIAPLLLIVGALKYLSHLFGYEVLEMNALFTSLVAGTIFLIGFLINGVLSDYKESEKLPSELSAAIRSLLDDAYTIEKSRNSMTATSFSQYQHTLLVSLIEWFYKRERTSSIVQKISQMNDYFIAFDNEGVPAPYIIKMKNEQANIRRIIFRIDTIRDTNFIGSAYAIVEAMAFLTALSLILTNITPFYTSLFFTLLVTFLIFYMIFLIKDLDNPFDFKTKGESGTEVSLKPLHDLQSTIG